MSKIREENPQKNVIRKRIIIHFELQNERVPTHRSIHHSAVRLWVDKCSLRGYRQKHGRMRQTHWIWNITSTILVRLSLFSTHTKVASLPFSLSMLNMHVSKIFGLSLHCLADPSDPCFIINLSLHRCLV